MSNLTFITNCLSQLKLSLSLGQKTTEHEALVGKPDGKRPLGRSRRSWNNTKLDYTQTGWCRLV
jgi:hypothetical protein